MSVARVPSVSRGVCTGLVSFYGTDKVIKLPSYNLYDFFLVCGCGSDVWHLIVCESLVYACADLVPGIDLVIYCSSSICHSLRA